MRTHRVAPDRPRDGARTRYAETSRRDCRRRKAISSEWRPLAAVLLSLLLAIPVLGAVRDEPQSPLAFARVPDPGPSVRLGDGPGGRRPGAPDLGVPAMRSPATRPNPVVPSPHLIVVQTGRSDQGQHQSGALVGTASYYDDGPGLYAAVHSYRWGDARYQVKVCLRDNRSRCVTVTVRDHCNCYFGSDDERLIDLSPAAFSRLAPLWRGTLHVIVAGLR